MKLIFKSYILMSTALCFAANAGVIKKGELTGMKFYCNSEKQSFAFKVLGKLPVSSILPGEGKYEVVGYFSYLNELKKYKINSIIDVSNIMTRLETGIRIEGIFLKTKDILNLNWIQASHGRADTRGLWASTQNYINGQKSSYNCKVLK